MAKENPATKKVLRFLISYQPLSQEIEQTPVSNISVTQITPPIRPEKNKGSLSGKSLINNK
jgi:hypothetical protein